MNEILLILFIFDYYILGMWPKYNIVNICRG